jgi:hypothetical protein
LTEKIKVKFYDSDTVAEIIFNNNKIDVISTDSKTKESLEECLEIWKKNFNLHGEKLFRKLPMITSRYSRMFFSGIEKE